MLQLNFDPFPVLTTPRLALRRFTVHDAPELFSMRSNEEVMKYINKPRPQSIDDIFQLVAKMDKLIGDNDGIAWAMTLKDDPKVMGHISYHVIRKEHHRAEVGYMMHPSYYGQGLMDEALKAVLQYGFNTMGLHSVEAIINPENASSRKLLEKNHFVQEAYFKEDFYWEGKYLDTAIFSLLAPAG